MPGAADVTLLETGFTVRGQMYLYDSIVSLRYSYVATHKRVNFVDAGIDYNAELDIYRNAVPARISIRTGRIRGALNMNRDQFKAERIAFVHGSIAQRTFQQRLDRYLAELASSGAFTYDGKRISADGTVTKGTRAINLKTANPLCRRPFEVFYPAPPTLLNKIARLFVGRRDFIIRTNLDGDVFMHLLAERFGRRWKT